MGHRHAEGGRCEDTGRGRRPRAKVRLGEPTCPRLDLRLAASRIGRKGVAAPPSLWCFAMAARAAGLTDFALKLPLAHFPELHGRLKPQLRPSRASEGSAASASLALQRIPPSCRQAVPARRQDDRPGWRHRPSAPGGVRQGGSSALPGRGGTYSAQPADRRSRGRCPPSPQQLCPPSRGGPRAGAGAGLPPPGGGGEPRLLRELPGWDSDPAAY